MSFLPQEIIERFIQDFLCNRDTDIEFFLKNKAFLFQNKNNIKRIEFRLNLFSLNKF